MDGLSKERGGLCFIHITLCFLVVHALPLTLSALPPLRTGGSCIDILTIPLSLL